MPAPPTSRNAVWDALYQHGQMSVVELVEHLGWSRNRVNKVIQTARKEHPEEFFRIVRYDLRPSGERGHETPIYAAERGKDVKRPVFDDAHRARLARIRYEKRRAQRVASRRSAPATPWDAFIPIPTRSTNH